MNDSINYKGTIILESLRKVDIVQYLNILSKEIWDVSNNNAHQPDKWTALTFENNDGNLDLILESIKSNLKPCWYVDISDEGNKYIIFPDKIISYKLNEKAGKQNAIEHGIKIGIPESQLDWP